MTRETTLLVLCVLALTGFGLLMVYSTGAVEDSIPWRTQCLYAVAGLVVMFVASRFDYHRLRDGLIYRGLALVSVALLLCVLFIGREVDGAQRWLELGPLRFQPAELARFALVVLLAVKLTENRDVAHTFFGGFAPPLIMAAVFTGLVVLERDLGIPAIMMGVSMVMMCAAGIRWRYLVGCVALVGAAGTGLILTYPHRVQRFVTFLDPWVDPRASGYQLIQSLSAFAQGGAFGRGAGASEQKLGYLPAAHTDFIFAVAGEEFGLVGTLALVALYAALLFAALRIAMHAADFFGMLLATGLGTLVALQAALIMAVNVGLLPTKGLPLPFISFGGTALIMFLGMMGVLVNIGSQAIPPEPAARRPVAAAGSTS